MVDVIWLFPQARNQLGSDAYLDAATIYFRPKPERSLGLGKWTEHRQHFLENVLFAELRNIANDQPASLFEESAKSQLLDEFDWSPLNLMTNN